jgi:hypothetical protein
MRTTYEPAKQRATPVWLGVIVVGGIVFGGNGMHPRDAVDAARAAPAIAGILAIAWLLLVAPVGRVLWRAPGTDFLRSLPAPRHARLASATFAILVVQLPWSILWFAGGGAALGAIATIAMALATLAVGIVPLPAHRPRIPHWRSAWRGLAGIHARGLVRVAGASIVRGLGLALLAGAAAGGFVRVNDLAAAEAATYGAAVATVPLTIALAGAFGAVAATDLRADWIARAAGVTTATRLVAIALVLVAAGTIAGIAAGATAFAIGGAPVGVAVALVAIALAAGGTRIVRYATLAASANVTTARVDGARIVIGCVALAVTAIVVLGFTGTEAAP